MLTSSNLRLTKRFDGLMLSKLERCPHLQKVRELLNFKGLMCESGDTQINKLIDRLDV